MVTRLCVNKCAKFNRPTAVATVLAVTHGIIGQRQAQSDVYIQLVGDDDVRLAMSNIGLRGDSEQSANTEPISDAQLSRETLASNRQTSEDYDLLTENSRTTTDQSQHNTINDGNRSASQSTGGTHKRDKDGKQNQGRAALSIPLAHYRPAHHTPMSQSPSDSSCASARHVLNPDGSEYEDIDSAVDDAPYEDVSSHTDVDSAAEYADVGGQAEAHDDISEYRVNSNQQLQLPQRAVNNVLVERRRFVFVAVSMSLKNS